KSILRELDFNASHASGIYLISINDTIIDATDTYDLRDVADDDEIESQTIRLSDLKNAPPLLNYGYVGNGIVCWEQNDDEYTAHISPDREVSFKKTFDPINAEEVRAFAKTGNMVVSSQYLALKPINPPIKYHINPVTLDIYKLSIETINGNDYVCYGQQIFDSSTKYKTISDSIIDFKSIKTLGELKLSMSALEKYLLNQYAKNPTKGINSENMQKEGLEIWESANMKADIIQVRKQNKRISEISIFSYKTGGMGIKCEIDGILYSSVKLEKEDLLTLSDKTDRKLLATKYFRDELEGHPSKRADLCSTSSRLLSADVVLDGERRITAVSNPTITDKLTGSSSPLDTKGIDLKELSENQIKDLLSGKQVSGLSGLAGPLGLNKTPAGWCLCIGKKIVNTADSEAGI
ncbi:MAG: hypothetical protein H6Q13_3026, partial [Bacteroidetes bacterium]|nr:hypothetical protein [Bacteroidota bacterium]